ncbi:MAG: hypothetical protein ABL963_09090 [Longimicrobiales bacterium]
MKAVLVYVGVVAGGAVVGAAGMATYNAVVVGVPAEEALGAEAAADSIAAEAHEGEAPDAEHAPSEPGAEPGPEADSEEPPQDESAPSDGGAAAAANEGTEAQPPAPGVVDADSVARVALNYQRLASIFSAMEPEEAAAVLEHLEDTQIERVLLAMQGRSAAPILAVMEPSRVAAISRRVLQGNP